MIPTTSTLLLCCVLGAAPADSLGKSAPDFELKSFQGKTVRLADYRDSKLVVIAFLGVECPLAKQYAPRLEQLSKTYADKGVAFLGIDSNQQDSMPEIAHFAKTHGIAFPMLKDVGNVVADALGAERTPEIYLLDGDGVIRYRGRVDDQYGFKGQGGYVRPEPSSTELKDAIEELLAGKPVTKATTVIDGCRIGRLKKADPDAPVTYTNQIARILQTHCNDCHRPGEIGPMAFQSYDEVAGWAEMINEVVQDQRMPPWHANPEHGQWSNDHRLSEEEKKQIAQWVSAGAPEGDPADLPEPKQYTEGWQIGTPDAVVYMSEKPFSVPAEGVVDYQYFTVDSGFTEDKWVRSIECRPGERSVVHHIIVFIQPPGVEAQIMEGGPANLALLQGEAPGMPATKLPDGLAYFIPAGSKFVFQMHYTTNGKAAEDRSAVGLVFADPKTVKHEVRTDNAINPFFEIPANAADHRVDADYRFWANTTLISLMPHMHLRGKSFRYTLKYPDGKQEVLLDIPRYDFNWQNTYAFATPKQVPAGSTLQCVATFDNSAENLSNPDPTKPVRWGEQTFEEMMIGWFVATTDSENSGGRERTEAFLAAVKRGEQQPSLQHNIAALGAFKSDRDFRRFARSTMTLVPQLDRVCVSTIEKNELVFLKVAQAPILNGKLGRTEFRVPIERSGLAVALSGSQPIMKGKGMMDAAHGEDMARMASVMKSAYHVPVTIGGQKCLISFWSRDEDAFPAEAQKILKGMATLSVKNAKLDAPVASASGDAGSKR